MKVKYKVLFVTIKTKFVQFAVVLLAGCRTELEVRHFMSCQLSWSFHMYIRRGRRRCLGSTIVVSENHIYMFFFHLSFEKLLGVNCSYERNCFFMNVLLFPKSVHRQNWRVLWEHSFHMLIDVCIMFPICLFGEDHEEILEGRNCILSYIHHEIYL